MSGEQLHGSHLPGFRAVFDLGFSDVLRTFTQGIGNPPNFGYALRTDGTVWKWEGRNVLVGNTYEPIRFVTKQVAPLEGVVSLAGNWAGSDSCRFALKADGTVWGWGQDYFDELGTMRVDDAEVPAQQPGIPAVVELITSSSGGTRWALTAQGEVWAWGANYSGGLGDGTTTDRQSPTPIPGLTDITSVRVAATGRCLALSSSGEVLTWGQPQGEAHQDRFLAPTRVDGLPPIAALFEDSATAQDGSFWVLDDQLVPTRVGGLNDVIAVVRDEVHWEATHHALRADGTIWGWGSNANGQLGDGTTIDSKSPVVVRGPRDVTSIVGRGPLRYALAGNGTVWGWGAVGYSDEIGATPSVLPILSAGSAKTFEKWGSIESTPVGNATNSQAALFDMSSGKTFLMHWSAVGAPDQVEALLRQGADPNQVDRDGDTALYYGLSRGNLNVVEVLLAHGANPNVAGTSGVPLHVASDGGWADIVDRMLSRGANVDQRARGGTTAAMLAAGAGRDDILGLLATHGADLLASDDDGDTALFYAASRGRVGTVKFLLSMGVSANQAPGASGQTPLSIATTLATPGLPLPPGASRVDYIAVAQLLTPPRRGL